MTNTHLETQIDKPTKEQADAIKAGVTAALQALQVDTGGHIGVTEVHFSTGLTGQADLLRGTVTIEYILKREQDQP